MSRPGRVRVAEQLVVDPVACRGIGVCALLAVDLVTLDRWGYPILERRELAHREEGQARSAVRACPRKALTVEPVDVRVRA